MSHCPSCGRYIGPRDACPYCAARTTGRMSIRAVKLAAVTLATLGLALLWFAATRADVPVVAIGRIDAAMNLAYVRVAGRCKDVPSYDPQTGYLSFWVKDETGEIHVASYRAETEVLMEEGRVPALGDRVAVAGTLRVRDDFHSLALSAPEELTITRAEAEPCPIGATALKEVYQRVRVRGQVRRVVTPYPGLTLVTLRDETGAVDVALSRDLLAISYVTPTVDVGRSVEVAAAVSDYRGTPQLVPASAADIISLPDNVSIAVPRFVTELSGSDVGNWITLRGSVTDVVPFSKGVKLTLDDGSGVVSVLLWQDVYGALDGGPGQSPALVPGMTMEARGELVEYKGDLELVPELPVDVRVIKTPSPEQVASERVGTANPTPLSPPTPSIVREARVTPIRSVSAEQSGERVTVEGVVVGAMSFSHGFKLILEEDGAQIALLIWGDVYDDWADKARLCVGATVQATGEVSLYQEELQVEPESDDIRVIETTPSAHRSPEVASIGAADEGRRLIVEGEVVRAVELSNGVKVFLRDRDAPSSEDVPVLIWRSVLERVVDNASLSMVGSHVRVVGTVQVYEQDLEVVPALPTDVQVLGTP